MKQQWTSEELLVSWMLTDTEKAFINSHYTGHNRVGIGTLLKCFQQDGRFPQRKQDIPGQIIVHIARQLNVSHDEFGVYGGAGERLTGIARASVHSWDSEPALPATLPI